MCVCNICKANYDGTLRRPCSLPCGHTVCSQCTKDAVQNALLVCPSCNTEHSATADAHFPISYGMEALMRKLEGVRQLSVAPGSAAPKEHSIKVSKTLQSLVEQHKSIINSLITGCEKVLSNLGEYQVKLSDWESKHDKVEDGLVGVVELNKAAVSLLDQEIKSVADMAKVGGEIKRQLQELLVCLDTPEAAHEVYVIIDDVDKSSIKLEDWLEKCEELFPDTNTVHTSIKMQETLKHSLKVTSEMEASVPPVSLYDFTSSILTRVQEINDDIFGTLLTVEHLQNFSQPIQRLVEAGRVFAVKQFHDGIYYARITLQEGRMYLHALDKQTLPAYAATVKYTDVVEMLDYTSLQAFLYLGRERSTMEQIVICLSRDTALGRHFIMLCTGELGKSYLNTHIHQVGYSPEHGEYMVFGEEEKFFSDLHTPRPAVKGVYGTTRMAGAVYAWKWPDIGNCMQFGVSLTNCAIPKSPSADVFGEVGQGLDVLRVVANTNDYLHEMVLDCGIVLPF
ncbi:uncharacterized protein [Procambarus clarkii]|uniref:uncharacterized protein n=1 Tax=Procambarus clarkii TaxID=6728 RepID=UPI001E6753C7|nr:uncharacterized protein LOC123745772 [Procambarus clarkii]